MFFYAFTENRKELTFNGFKFDLYNYKILIMKKYYVNNNAQSNGDHEVHNEDCKYLSSIASKKYLGEFSNCKPAVTEAKKTYSQSNGCKTCSPDCHTS